MNNYFKQFLHRGLLFGGFGPIVLGIVFLFLQLFDLDLALDGYQISLGIVSTYLLAFLHAGASIFNQIEHWSLAKSLFFHFLTLYFAYIACYLLNTWIPFKVLVIAIFTLIFVVSYFVIWITVYLIVKHTSKKMNKKIKAA